MTWEERVKVVGAGLSLLAILVGGWQYLRTQSIAAARPYLEKKLEWCAAAVDLTSAIAVREEPDPARVREFWQIYWGRMVLIENAGVEAAMVAFGEALEDAGRPEADSKSGNSALVGLRGASLRLGRACRDELAGEWSTSWRRRGSAEVEPDTSFPTLLRQE